METPREESDQLPEEAPAGQVPDDDGELNVDGRSKMNKAQLQRAVDRKKNQGSLAS